MTFQRVLLAGAAFALVFSPMTAAAAESGKPPNVARKLSLALAAEAKRTGAPIVPVSNARRDPEPYLLGGVLASLLVLAVIKLADSKSSSP